MPCLTCIIGFACMNSKTCSHENSLNINHFEILAQVLVLSSIPSDSNNNDILIQAMKLSEINADIKMDF